MPENTENLREKLIELLKHHDWDYQYCDDYSGFRRGNEQRKVIYDLVRQVPDGAALYEQYRPKEA